MKNSRKINFHRTMGFLALSLLLSAGAASGGEMVLIPAGNYVPLFRADSDAKSVSVRPFHLDVLPVTNADFLAFVTANPKWRRSSVKRIFADGDYLKTWAADTELGLQVSSNAPVTHVSWFAAKAYSQWKGKRLPTTAEWEYVAAASPSRADGANDAAFVREIRQWYSTPTPTALSPVGQKTPNYFGVHDLHGLVWEWVADFNTAMVTGDARGDTGLDRQLFCGSGSEGAKDRDNFPAFMRYGFRSSLKASYTVHNLGFRCAQNVEETINETN
jgi:sulfatase modifying factor 1